MQQAVARESGAQIRVGYDCDKIELSGQQPAGR